MSESLKAIRRREFVELLKAYGNAQFDCGDWREDTDGLGLLY